MLDFSLLDVNGKNACTTICLKGQCMGNIAPIFLIRVVVN